MEIKERIMRHIYFILFAAITFIKAEAFAFKSLIRSLGSRTATKQLTDTVKDARPQNTLTFEQSSHIFARHREMANIAACEELTRCKNLLSKEQLNQLQYQIDNSCVTADITKQALNLLSKHYNRIKNYSKDIEKEERYKEINALARKELKKHNVDADILITHLIAEGQTVILPKSIPDKNRPTIVHPTLVIPYHVEIGDKTLEDIIEHEITHIKNKDGLIQSVLFDNFGIDTARYKRLTELRAFVHGATKNEEVFKATYPKYKKLAYNPSAIKSHNPNYPTWKEIHRKLKLIKNEIKQAKQTEDFI